jgi:uncharacterized protein (TIGR03435 family)
MQRIVILLGVFAVATTAVAAQAPPSFEVASVKPNVAAGNNVFIQMQPGGRLVIRGVPLRQIINWAYQLRPDDERLIAAPEWTRTERFDVVAKAPGGIPLGSINPVGPPSPGLLMLRTLLAERFQLRMRTETRELPIYALVTANTDRRLGPKLIRSERPEAECERIKADRLAGRPSSSPLQPGRPAPCAWLGYRSRLTYDALPLEELANFLSGHVWRLVVDRTGLTGLFDVDFTWTPDQLPPPDAPDRIIVGGTEIDLTGGVTIDPNGAALLTSLREQLGLRLEATRAPVEVLVVERIDRPTPD